MKLREIYEILNAISPFELQEKWDNSGLQVGSFEQRVDKVYCCVDLDEDLVESLPNSSLLITHHPLIFGKLTCIDFDGHPGRLIRKLIQKEIALVAMHTNFDKTHLNRYVARSVLEVEPSCEGFVCTFEKEGRFEEILDWVKRRFDLECPKYIKTKDHIQKIALTTGSGGSLIDSIEADLFLTGDIKYHDAMKAQTVGLSMIDIGHYESERFFGECLADELKKAQIKAIIASVKNPLKA